jgi:CopG family nickel-responsive transcriptional regulator
MAQETSVARFSVSLPANLLGDLDAMVGEKGYANRSLAIADMVRAQLVQHREESGRGDIAGTITIVYDHHKRHLQTLLTNLQHDHGDVIIATLHVHLDHDHCLEVLAVRGPTPQIKALSDALISAKGVKHGQLTITGTGEAGHAGGG